MKKFIQSVISLMMNFSKISARICRRYLCSQFYLNRTFETLKGNEGNSILLTFDDGPDPKVTPALLKLLKQYNVKAIFFINGVKAAENERLIEEIASDGHVLGNHTYSHRMIVDLSIDEFYSEVNSCQKIIEKYQNKIKLFRPPWGLIIPSQYKLLKNKGYKVLLWTIDSNDSGNISLNQIFGYLNKHRFRKEVMLLHDDAFLCLDILDKMIPTFRSMGLTFINYYS